MSASPAGAAAVVEASRVDNTHDDDDAAAAAPAAAAAASASAYASASADSAATASGLPSSQEQQPAPLVVDPSPSLLSAVCVASPEVDSPSDRVLLPSASFAHVQVDDRAPPASSIRIDREGNSRRSKSAQLQIRPGDLLPDAPAAATLALPPLHKGASSPDQSQCHSDAESDGKAAARPPRSARRTLDAPLSVLLTPGPPPSEDGRRSAPHSRRNSGSVRPDLPLSPSPPTLSSSAAALLASPPAPVVPPPSALLPPLSLDTELVLDFQCEGLDRMHLLYKASPYLELYQCARSNIELRHAGPSRSAGRGNFFESVYKTETVLHKLHPVFKRVVVSAHALCRCEYDRTIMIRVWDESRSGDDAMLMGECQATLRDLLLPLYSKETDAIRIPLVRPEIKESKAGYTNSGFLVVTSVALFRQIPCLPGFSKPKHRRTTSSARDSKDMTGDAAVAALAREQRHLRRKSSKSNLMSPDAEAGPEKEERRHKRAKKKSDKKKSSSKPPSRSHSRSSRDVSDSDRDDDSAPVLSVSSVHLFDFVPSYLSVVGVSIHGLSKTSWLSAPNPFFVLYGKASVDRAWRDKSDKDGTSASAEDMRAGGAGSGKPEATVAAALAALVAPPAAPANAATAAASPPAAVPVAADAAAAVASASVPSSSTPLVSSASCASPVVWIPQWTSDVKNNALSAEFDPFVLDVSCLINGDWDEQIKLAVCSSSDGVKIVRPELLGSCTLSVREFLTGTAALDDSCVDSAPLDSIAMNPNQHALIAQRQQASRTTSAGTGAAPSSSSSSAKGHSRKKSAKHRAELTLFKPVVLGSKASPVPSPPLPACTFHVRVACLLESVCGPRLHSFADDSELLLREMALVRVGAFGSALMTPAVRAATPTRATPSPTLSMQAASEHTTSAAAVAPSGPSSDVAAVAAAAAPAPAPAAVSVPKRFATLSARDGAVVLVGGSATNGGNEEKGHSRRATLDRRLSLEKAADNIVSLDKLASLTRRISR